MELYYHVVRVKKKKECRFNFCYIANPKLRVCGSATVDLKTPLRTARFDAQSTAFLGTDEKEYIVSSILKHI